jgi:hypothetical protein
MNSPLNPKIWGSSASFRLNPNPNLLRRATRQLPDAVGRCRIVLSFPSSSVFQSRLKTMRKLLNPLSQSLVLLSLLAPLTGCVTPRAAEQHARADRARALFGARATYSNAPRKADGRVDVDRLIAELIDLHANTYSFGIHGRYTDWDDLKLILPRAREKGIRIWASLVPPSESPPHTKMYAEPFKLDYQRWAVEFARLSLQHTNLVAWSIDDFTHNLTKPYTPVYVGQMLAAARRINPKLAFAPCCYFPAIKPSFVTNYCPLIDGILFPYRHESAKANLKDPTLVESEVKQIKGLVGPSFTIVLDIYATAHSSLGATTPEYVAQAMIAGKRAADGVMIYCHQDPEKNREKYQIIRELFGRWAAEKTASLRTAGETRN